MAHKRLASPPTTVEVQKITAGRTWAEIKKMAEEAGVRDSDVVTLIDIGPNLPRLFIRREDNSTHGLTFIEISDDPTVIADYDY